jgi:hypothetical protein
LPAIKADNTHNINNVIYNALDHDGGVGGAGLLEEFGEGGFAAVFIFSRRNFFFDVDQVAGEVEQGFEEGDAVQLSLCWLLVHPSDLLGF